MTRFTSANPRQDTRLAIWSGLALWAVMLMDLAWITLGYLAITHHPAPWPRVVAVLAASLCGSYYLNHVLRQRATRLGVQRACFVAWLLVCLVLAAVWITAPRPQAGNSFSALWEALFQGSLWLEIYPASLAVLLAAWLGQSLERRPLVSAGVQSAFKLGLAVFLGLAIFWGWQNRPGLILAFYAFLAAGLVGMAAARIADLESEPGGRLPRFNLPWMGQILGIVLAVLFLSSGLAWVLGHGLAQLLTAALAALLSVFLAIVVLILTPLLSLILELTYRLGQNIWGDLQFQSPPQAAQQALNQMVRSSQQTLDLGALWNQALPLLTALLLVGIVLLLAARLRRQGSWQRRRAAEEDTQALGHTPAPPTQGASRRGLRLRDPRRLLAAARIRHTYAQFIDLMDRLGHPRPPALTPLEFLPTAQAALPDCAPELARLTQAYLNVRYGELPETDAEVQAILAAWGHIRAEGRRQINAARSKR
ncbi:MAG: DUF4129 domain-containing protein [Chloroflexi bacterium]|nr:DUF4129 domain-containing protein [Chloroflexota bacterium]